jgi:undecaprenyl phosphate N,N'-diacetylbacillosamine 1-phosphate transferase
VSKAGVNKSIQNALKRLIDVSISLIALLVLSIPFAIIAIAIKLDSKGPVFFRQERVGKRGKIFTAWKFRTMTHEPASEGYRPPPSPGDKSVTKLSGLLRSSGLDELPQVINIFLGDMSLVGPRPVHPFRAESFGESGKTRHEMKPGLTGWAIIHGRNSLTWEQKIVYDIWYVKNFSLGLDFLILWKTPWIILRKEGVFMNNNDHL